LKYLEKDIGRMPAPPRPVDKGVLDLAVYDIL